MALGAGCAKPEDVPAVPGPASGPPVAAALEWTVSPWRERPARALATAGAALGLWLLARWLLPGARGTATLLGLLCLAALSPGMAATRCRLDEAGAARRLLLGWERRRWDQVRRARVGRGGLLVSPLARPGRLDRFRALFLPFPRRDAGGVRAAVLREVARRGL